VDRGDSRAAATRLRASNERALRTLRGLGDPPAGIDPTAFRAAVEYACGRYEVGLPHYHRAVTEIGFTGRDRVLDVGSGAGHWSIALAYENARVDGIEPRREYVAIADTVAAALELDERVSFRVARAEDDLYRDESFELVCCHSVLMYTDHERAVGNIARLLTAGGRFYLGYTTLGHRLQVISEAAAEEKWDRVLGRVRVLMADLLYRCGLHRTPRSRVRVFAPDELARLARFFGLRVVSQPGVQDDPGSFLGHSRTVDFVFERSVTREEPPTPEDLYALERLIQDGLPHTVCALLTERADALAPATLDLLVRALIKAGRTGEPSFEPALAQLEGPEHGLARGLALHERWEFASALEQYRLAEARDAGFLSAACLLTLGRLDEARAAFEAEEGLRGWAGELACALEAGDFPAAGRLCDRMSRDQLGF
jgi:SAM-dependent methyltransferase